MYINTTVIVISYGCGTWSIILKEKQRLRVFQNRVLEKIFAAEWGRGPAA
jgi:hypothetical protein